MTRHLVGAAVGVVAVPVLLVLSFLMVREARGLAVYLRVGPGHGLLLLLLVLFTGAVTAVLCGGRLVSPVASLVSGAVLFVVNLIGWLPYLLPGVRTMIHTGNFIWDATVGYGPVLFVVAVTLLGSSAWPTRWKHRDTPPPPPPGRPGGAYNPPRPLPSPEVHQ